MIIAQIFTKKYQKTLIVAFFLLIVLFIGSYWRFFSLSAQSYWIDESYTIIASDSIITNGIINGNSVLDSGQKMFCPLYCYPTAKISQMMSNTPFSYRFLSVIAGILLILLIFYLTYKFFGLNSAYLSTIFTAMSYWQIAWSRQARWYTLFTLFFWLAIYFFYQTLKQKDKKQIIYSLLAFSFTLLSILTHRLGLFLIAVYALWLIYTFFQNKKINYKTLFLYFFIALLLFLVSLLLFGPQLFFNLSNKINFSYLLPYYLNFYFRNYWLFIVFGLFAYFNSEKEKKEKIIFLVLAILPYLVYLAFFNEVVHYRYLFHLTPILYMLAAVGLVDLSQKIKYNYQRHALILAFILLLILTKHLVIWPQQFYFLESDDPAQFNRPHYAYTPQPDFKAAYDVVKSQLKPTDIIISAHPTFNQIYLDQPGYWIKYNYWGRKEANNFEKITDDKDFYVAAKVIDDLAELKEVTSQNHGYVVLDFMSINDRIPQEILDHITNNFTQVYHNKLNTYSQVWVYQF